MATIMCLPDEVIDNILGYNDITIEDIISFRCVCKKFRSAAKYDKHWEEKLSQRWSSAKKLYEKQSEENEKKESKENEQKDKKSLNFVETGINCARELRSYVSKIIHEHYHDNESIDNCDHKPINNLIKFKDVFYLDENIRNNIDETLLIFKPEDILKYSFFIDEIKNLLTQSSRRTGCDLTKRYCNIKIIHYMRQRSIKQKWYRLLEQPRELLLERAATIMAQWFQSEKDVFYSCVKASLDSIAQEILNCLREKHPEHSIFLTSAETFSYWKNNNINDNHWNEAEGTQIMDTLQEHIFGKLNFRPSNSEDRNLEFMCIDNVLKNKYGQEIIIFTIYHSVARRLGLRCDILGLQHYSLTLIMYYIFWKPEYSTNSLEDARCFNISSKKFPDCLVNELSLWRILYARRDFEDVFVITADRMWQEMRKLIAYWTNPYNKPFGLNPFKHEHECGEKSLMLSLCVKKTEQLNTRAEDVQFAVGMIVTHGDKPTNSCVGVIVGWHRHVDKHMFSIQHVTNYKDFCFLPLNHCDNFNATKPQTYYIILTKNNDMCYVGEDDITLTTPTWIENSEIGRYFCKFEDTHYVPNKMLARIYPQDAAITAQTISKN